MFGYGVFGLRIVHHFITSQLKKAVVFRVMLQIQL
jgi:hypothetical protein